MASKRRLRRKTCENKIRYATKDEALAAARKIFRAHGDSMSAYGCGSHFHLGHLPAAVRQIIAERRAHR
jgi:hypothetical protein